MSGWTIVMVRGRENRDYPPSKYDDIDHGSSQDDIVATMDVDDRVYSWTTRIGGYVYAQLDLPGYNFEAAEHMLRGYEEMIEDAVVLCANDTSDSGTARYYREPFMDHLDEFDEDTSGNVGGLAMAMIMTKYGFYAQDPFHDRTGILDDLSLKNGTDRLSPANR